MTNIGVAAYLQDSHYILAYSNLLCHNLNTLYTWKSIRHGYKPQVYRPFQWLRNANEITSRSGAA
jgi:hypothetical protein